MATIRETYALRHEGHIGGVPGIWPAGATVTVERDTATGLATVVQVLPGESGEVTAREEPAAAPDPVASVPDVGEIAPPVPTAAPVQGEFVIPVHPMQFSDEEGR